MLTQTTVLTRDASNPILSKDDVPYSSSLVFNAGVTKWQGRYVMVFRNDYGFDRDTAQFEGTNLGLAFSDDGVEWSVEPNPCLEICNAEIHRAYDPRLTVIDDRCYMCFAVDTVHGIRGAVAVTDDFKSFDILSMSAPDNRNMVLFPEKINGRYTRFERPMPIYGRGGEEAFDLWMADSPDLVYWGNNQLVIGSEQLPYCNSKIGPGAPPVKTERGWLAIIHTVWKDASKPLHGWELGPWTKQYAAAVALLDLENPAKVIGFSREPVLVPTASYEIEGYREAVFPTGMILEDDGEVKIYYGGADTVMCLARAGVDELLGLIT